MGEQERLTGLDGKIQEKTARTSIPYLDTLSSMYQILKN